MTSTSLRGRLGEFAGDWFGRNSLWMEPGTPVHECATTASVSREARGVCTAIRYAWEFDRQPQEGLLLVLDAAEPGPDDVVWVDSFHTAGRFMRLNGEPDEQGRIAALGSYAAPTGPDWGWRIVIGSDGPEELHLLMYNIVPDEAVYPAVEARYRRVS
jgi:hypothetical protein